MKNKGFTLAELLVVILVLGLIATITTPIVTNFITTSRQKACERQKEMILDATKRYVSDNAGNFSLNSEKCEGKGIDIQELQDDGYLDDELKNPKTNTLFDKGACILIEEDSSYNQYKYIFKEEPCQ